MKCKDIGYLSSDYMSGDMTRCQRLNFRLHITLCGHCRRFTHQMNLIHQTLPQYRFIDPDDQQVEAWLRGVDQT